jgi:D-arabinose 1-dehydrogenase-like Zn-dependent alcohol dehydrogenase
MRAARLTGWRAPLEIAEAPDPVPPEGGVVLKVLACGICRSDWHAWTGGDPVALPIVLGHEYCGEVAAVGAGVRRWRVGDRVVAPFILACGHCPACAAGEETTCPDQALPGFTRDGAYAEYLAVPFADTNLAPLPQGMDPALAAAFGCRVTTAWHALTGRAGLRPGEWLAVFGAGGVGLAAAMLGRAMGARVVAVDVVPEKLAFARAQGAEAVVDATRGDADEAVRAATGGGVHVAVEALGLPVTAGAALRSLRKLGRMVQVGMPAGDHLTQALPWDAVYSGQLAVFGTRGMPAWRYPALFDFLAATGLDLSPLIARRVRLSDASAELRAFDGPAPPGVAVITDFAA